MKLKKITKFLLAIGLVTAFATSYAQEIDRNDKDGDGIKDRKDLCPATPAGVKVDANGCPLDTDRDGVVDYLDKCPDTPGSAAMNGCQDKDNDGVADNEDSCPDVPGLARFKGCPDSDNDGVEDSKDKCPNQKGLDRFNGCPDTDGDGIEDSKDKCNDTPKGVKVDANGCSADSDNDGVIDSDDKCPNTKAGIKVDANGCAADTDKDGVIDSEDACPAVAGTAANKGCPEKKVDVKKRLQFAARGINFETGKATLTTASYPMLDEVVSILNEYVDYNLKMGGHTDAVGKDAANLALSQARVDAVKAYLLSKGIADTRVVATGFGEIRPVASNTTAVGRAKNRRVELELFLK
ncbi:OmpA family protein [Pedobacter cryophilus]|uniref:OmpA family protein n=1 Tax=Pedobacter cryophilus TaxID=2571271 RepID=A0A4U1C578_9SPHI|nr:OmpA family protein [Pedobacter cryophilus]TKC00529.1 OmpA family protein [Pedobacter cryophilus]